MTTRAQRFWRRQLLASKSKHRLPYPPKVAAPSAPALTLTLAEIQERSPTPCRHCKFHFAAHGVPCLVHTLPSERAARSRTIGVTR